MTKLDMQVRFTWQNRPITVPRRIATDIKIWKPHSFTFFKNCKEKSQQHQVLMTIRVMRSSIRNNLAEYAVLSYLETFACSRRRCHEVCTTFVLSALVLESVGL